jgi:hypothetical protein
MMAITTVDDIMTGFVSTNKNISNFAVEFLILQSRFEFQVSISHLGPYTCIYEAHANLLLGSQ